ncbi:MAG TPA: M90 family metallopeptidase [Burkholderiales bacterium]|nr:M90 family metallopeptidase [Burkholderiales bacterium]
MLQRLKARYRYWRLSKHPVPDRLWVAALRTAPYANVLPKSAHAKLRELTTLFLLDKRFTTAHDLALTDGMRVVTALKACIPILELGLGYYDHFKGIVLYPGDFRVREQQVDDAGVVHEEVRELCGQSLSNGPIVLSWDTLKNEHAQDGQDLMIHECAHKLDILNGDADGFPPLHSSVSANDWTRTLQRAYDALCCEVDAERPTRIDPYACADAAEFFAVASETFFTRPDILFEDFPDVYRQLADFYRQDPYALIKHHDSATR